MTAREVTTDVRVRLYFNYANFPLPGEREVSATPADLRRWGLSAAIRNAYEVPPDIVIRELAPLQRYRDSYPTLTGQSVSLWHNTCLHRRFNLTCEQYETLLAESNYCCRRCGQASSRLHVDHDHDLGMWAVRGIVCPWCNNHLGRVDNGLTPCDAVSRTYLDNPPTWRRPFNRKPFHAFTTLVQMWESSHGIPKARHIGWASQYGMNAALRRLGCFNDRGGPL